MKDRKKLCDQCNLDGNCWCQTHGEKEVSSCGMEKVFTDNKIYKKALKEGRLTQDYIDE